MSGTLALFAREHTALVDSTDLQCTPRDLALDLGRFGIDPCSNPLSHVLADRTCMLEHGQDGLADPWTIDGTSQTALVSAFVNGPYANPLPWCKRLRAHSGPWAALWKLDTTTAWWRTLAASGATWAPFRARLAFERDGNCGVANFSSALWWHNGWKPSKAVLARLWQPRRERC